MSKNVNHQILEIKQNKYVAIIIYNFTVIPMRVAFGCTLVAVSTAVQMTDFQGYFKCI